jgi:hypothetical protein
MKRMTPAEMVLQERVKAEVEKGQARMGLSDWQVLVKLLDPELGEPTDFFAAVEPSGEITPCGLHWWAELRINRQHQPPEEQLPWVVVHELCHLLVQPFVEWTVSVLDSGCFSPEYADGWRTNHNIKEEQLVQKLCEAIIGARQPWLANEEEP